KAMLGDSSLQGDVKLTAGPPAQYSLSFKAPGIDLGNLLQVSGVNSFISGSSPHEMAATTQGHIDFTASGGTISSAAAGSIASGLAEVVAPGTANPALNCAAARFAVVN